MKVKYNKKIENNIENNIEGIHKLLSLIIDIFKDVQKTKIGNTLEIGKDKYITFDYHSKGLCSCYLELGNTYCRVPYNTSTLLNRVDSDPYIKRKFRH